MKIRKSYHQQLNLLSYSPDHIQWEMLPLTVRNDIEILLAQLILSVHHNQQSQIREHGHGLENNE